MGLLYFKKNGTIERYDGGYEYESVKGQNAEIIKDSTTLLSYLNHYVDIEYGCTFEVFFNKILDNEKLLNIIFKDHMGGYELGEFINEWKSNTNISPIKDIEVKIDFLLVSRFEIDISYDNIDNNSISFGAYGEIIKGKTKDRGPITISMAPINQLKPYVIKLDPSVDVVDRENGYKPILKFYRYYTLYDIVSAILYEITYWGNPNERDQMYNELINEDVDFLEAWDEFNDDELDIIDNDETIDDDFFNLNWYDKIIRKFKIDKG